MSEQGGPSRREVLLGSAGLAAGTGLAVGGIAWRMSRDQATAVTEPARPTGEPATGVTATGTVQAGIDRPDTPQPHGLITVWDLPRHGTLDFLTGIGRRILELTDPATAPADLPDGPGTLSVTIGLGPAVVRSVGPDLPGATDLPEFNGDSRIEKSARGGDLLIAVYSDHPGDLRWVAEDVASRVPGSRLRWSQSALRNPSTGTVTRNPLGFHDGIIVPRGPEALAENVWLDGPLAGGTICVIRRLRLDVRAFRGLELAAQEAIIGRKRDGGEPLSGGDRMAEADLRAKTPEGEFLIPPHSHVRAAHPSFTGSHLMLRRGYGFDNGTDAAGVDDSGLLFICFQKDLHTFVAIQRRLDEVDDLMRYAVPTASATFLILPGFDDATPLGTALAGR